MYLLWKYLAARFDLPDDIKQYLATQFYIPFIQVERERVKIDEVYNVFYVNDEVRMLAAMNGQFLAKVMPLLADESLIFDTRIGNKDRIVKCLRMLNPIKSIPEVPVKQAVTLLNKGLSIDSMIAFDILEVHRGSRSVPYYYNLSLYYAEMKSFLYRMAAKIRLSVPILAKDITPQTVRRLLLICLEMGILDETLQTFLVAARIIQADWRLDEQVCYTDTQRNNLVLFEKEVERRKYEGL